MHYTEEVIGYQYWHEIAVAEGRLRLAQADHLLPEGKYALFVGGVKVDINAAG